MAQVNYMVFGFKPLGKNHDINKSINELIKQLNRVVINYIAETKKINFRDYYELINDKSKLITFNTKDITYSENLNFNDCKLDFDNQAISYASTENSLDIFNLIDKGKNPHIVWNGEYPFLKYNIIRIGNSNYEFLTYSR